MKPGVIGCHFSIRPAPTIRQSKACDSITIMKKMGNGGGVKPVAECARIHSLTPQNWRNFAEFFQHQCIIVIRGRLVIAPLHCTAHLKAIVSTSSAIESPELD